MVGCVEEEIVGGALYGEKQTWHFYSFIANRYILSTIYVCLLDGRKLLKSKSTWWWVTGLVNSILGRENEIVLSAWRQRAFDESETLDILEAWIYILVITNSNQVKETSVNSNLTSCERPGTHLRVTWCDTAGWVQSRSTSTEYLLLLMTALSQKLLPTGM